MDGALKGWLIVLAILVVFGGGPIFIVKYYNYAKYRKRTEEVLGYVQAKGYEFYGGTVNDLNKLREIAPGYLPDVAATQR